MALTQINPTRMELSRLKKKLATATRGHKLLKDKRDELMRRFLDMARLNRELRQKVEKAIADANKKFILACTDMSLQSLSTALLLPKQEITIDVSYKNIMSVDTPKFKVHTRTSDENDIYCYGLAFTSADLDDAVYSLSSVLSDMLSLAEIEKSCQLLSNEIEKTRRRVNALEHFLIPQTKDSIKYISMKLDENERTTQTRLMKVKSMVLQKAHNYG